MRKLEVRLTRKLGQELIVGQLAETGPRPSGGQVVFEYDPVFLRDPLWLSPFKLPFERGQRAQAASGLVRPSILP